MRAHNKLGFPWINVVYSVVFQRRLTHRLGYGNEEHQGNPLALPSGGVSKKEIDEVVEWVKSCVYFTPRMVAEHKGVRKGTFIEARGTDHCWCFCELDSPWCFW